MDQSKETDALRAALTDACDLLEGWVLTKCPKRYRAEHMAHIVALRSTGSPQVVGGRLTVAAALVAWLSAAACLPDDSRTVQMHIPDGSTADEDTTLGWYEPGERRWYSLAGDPLPDGAVAHWAERTGAPICAPTLAAGG